MPDTCLRRYRRRAEPELLLSDWRSRYHGRQAAIVFLLGGHEDGRTEDMEVLSPYPPRPARVYPIVAEILLGSEGLKDLQHPLFEVFSGTKG